MNLIFMLLGDSALRRRNLTDCFVLEVMEHVAKGNKHKLKKSAPCMWLVLPKIRTGIVLESWASDSCLLEHSALVASKPDLCFFSKRTARSKKCLIWSSQHLEGVLKAPIHADSRQHKRFGKGHAVVTGPA